MAGTPRGFNASKVLAGLHTAMEFGLPNVRVERPTFVMPPVDTTTAPKDDENVPWDPSATVLRAPSRKVQVECAYEYQDALGKLLNLGVISPSRVKITLLAPEYVKVKGFEFVLISAQRYFYQREEPVIALGSIDVHTVHCVAEDEG